MSENTKEKLLNAIKPIVEAQRHDPNFKELIVDAVLAVFETEHPSRTPVKYVGKRPEYSDGIFETGKWKKDQVKMVPIDIAKRMILHDDVYQEGGDSSASEIVDSPSNKEEEKEDEAQADGRNAVNNMQSKTEIKKFVANNFSGQKIQLPKDADIDDYRAEAIRMIDTFHLPK